MSAPLGPVIGRYPSSNGNDGRHLGGIIRHNRKCRDVPFLILFIAFWVAMIVNSSFGFNQGSPLRLTYGLDYKGNVCGDKHTDPDLRGLELRYWVKPNEVFQSGLKTSKFKLEDARAICLKNCPSASEDSLKWVCDYPKGDIHLSIDEWVYRDYDYFEFLTPDMRNSSLQFQGPCYPVLFRSINVMWNCQYVGHASNISIQHWQQMGGLTINEGFVADKSIHKSINSRSSAFKRYVADIGKAWPVLIVCGGILPLFLSVIWLLMVRYYVTGMAWITVFLFNFLTISVTMFYYLKAGWIGNDAVSPIIGPHDSYYQISGREQGHLHVVAVFMSIILIIAVLSSIAIIRRIFMTTSVLKVASKSIGEVHALIVFPIIPYTLLAVFYTIWFSAMLHLFSSGKVIQNKCNLNCCFYDLGLKRLKCDSCCGYHFHYTPHIRVAIVFHLFGCYWGTQFLKACSSTVIAGAVASYYWASTEALQEILLLPVFTSMKRLIRYNLGSVAIGSLLVSFIESIHCILKPIRKKLNAVRTRPENCLGKLGFSTSRCSLTCIGWTIRSINRNAYIMVAITGEHFFTASTIATGLIRNNILRVGKVNIIGDVVLFLGKLCVSLTSAVFAFLMLDTHKYRSAHKRISSPLFPVLVCWLLGYVVADLFFQVVEISIETIILSFCQDSDEHQGSAQFAPALLIESLGDQTEM